MDMRNRFELSIPSTYFGNCLMMCGTALPKRKLLGENGICEAANVIAREISLADPLKEVEKFGIKSNNFVCVMGSPKFDVYETDFGWGNPILSEILHLSDSNGFLLSDSKDGYGSIEVSMLQEEAQVKKFTDILDVQLRDIVAFE
ncbi:unnamed protein product [Lathyrus sativus]|nr:unnamed protein product [Lathyrus sativus]